MMKRNKSISTKISQQFNDYDRQGKIKGTKTTCILVMVLMPVGFFLDFFVYPSYLWYFLTLRLICSLLTAILWWLIKTSFGQKYYQIISMGYLLPAFFICWMIAVTEGAASPYYAGLNLIMIAIVSIWHERLKESCFSILLILITYLTACFWHGRILEDVSMLFNNLYFLILTGIIVLTGNYFYNRLRFQEFVLRHQLIEADKAKSQFFANISHELRTPLTLLLSPLQKLHHQKNTLFDAETKQHIDLMHANGMRLLKLINDLLDLLKLESRALTLNPKLVNLKSFVLGLISSVQGMAQDKGLTVTSTIQDNIGTVWADADKLEKILLNLLFNAIKFTPAQGHVDVTVRRQDERLIFEVKDTGIGITCEQLPFIFDHFWQADASSKRKYQGTGIGLALVKELTEAHNGSIHAESRESQGTVITVNIPCENPKTTFDQNSSPFNNGSSNGNSLNSLLTELYQKAVRTPPAYSSPDSCSVEESIVSQKKDDATKNKPCVLIADDEPDMLRFISMELKRDYVVIQATDGQQAVDYTERFLPDLVLLDVMMPEKDGIEVCQALRARFNVSIPIILLTAHTDEKTKIDALKAGVTDFLTKPFSTSELQARIKNAICSFHLQTQLSKQLKELKDTKLQLIQTEKLASLGRLSAGIIHEINNPLNFITSIIHVLQKKQNLLLEQERLEYNETIEDMSEGLHRIKRIVSDLRTFTHPGPQEFKKIPVSHVIELTLRLLSNQWKDKITIHTQIAPEHTVWGDQNHLVQVVLNILQNAIDALDKNHNEKQGNPAIWITSSLTKDDLTLTIRDNGLGIEPDCKDKLFEPFFTTKDVGEGLGIGLSICYRIIQEHHGRIYFTSENGFTDFILKLPVMKTALNKHSINKKELTNGVILRL